MLNYSEIANQSDIFFGTGEGLATNDAREDYFFSFYGPGFTCGSLLDYFLCFRLRITRLLSSTPK